VRVLGNELIAPIKTFENSKLLELTALQLTPRECNRIDGHDRIPQ
jgi:hypothetical protein